MTLLDAVDVLTLPVTVRVPQELYATRFQPDGRPAVDEDGNPIRERKGTQTVTVTHEPLLHQLEAAVASTMGGAGRGSTLPWELNMLDGDALYKFAGIASQIADWCRVAGVKPDRHPAENLRAWYVATLHRNLEPAVLDGYETVLHGWAVTIKAKLNPPRVLELTSPCPSCKASVWVDVEGVSFTHPVKIEYWGSGPDVLEHARATCRACDSVWKGSSALRALRYDVDTIEQERESTMTDPDVRSTT